jgi:hypothetical protein
VWTTEPKRKPIPLRVKRIVYERAKGKCRKCGTRLKMDEGDFHHKGKPTSTRPSSIVFLCPNCHRKYGHKYRIVKHETVWGGVEKERKIIRQRIVRKKAKKHRRIAVRDISGQVIRYRTARTEKTKKRRK